MKLPLSLVFRFIAVVALCIVLSIVYNHLEDNLHPTATRQRQLKTPINHTCTKLPIDVFTAIHGNGHMQYKSTSSMPYLNLDNSRKYAINNLTVVQDGIFWSDELLQMSPKGTSVQDIYSISSKFKFSNINVTGMETRICSYGSSPNNARVTLTDGTQWCARYKPPCFILGELMAYYFSLMMHMNYIPAVILTKPDPSTPQWGSELVKEFLKKRKWDPNNIITMTKWIPNLRRILVSNIMRYGDRLLHIDNPMFSNVTQRELFRLIAYSDATILDYLMAESDRVLFLHRHNFKYRGDNKLIHNLFFDENSKAWMLDNEMSFFWGQTLQTPAYAPLIGILKSVCIFRRQTVEMVFKLHAHKNVPRLLWEVVNEHVGPLDLEWNPQKPIICELHDKQYTIDWANTFTERIEKAYMWITRCSEAGYESLLNDMKS
ncbi:four-jointed box protein 1-like [Saccoglossus kowalevskii]|uniref:Four-jointed box protein 1-like n=1 Tax=Saccoglossus kowalevskii TaxID=10224 RepID=A0ABM0GL46_SACKO|nr:PREDICTED: four-jointed box protein 1-like [Saccoglossus kowalevskii]